MHNNTMTVSKRDFSDLWCLQVFKMDHFMTRISINPFMQRKRSNLFQENKAEGSEGYLTPKFVKLLLQIKSTNSRKRVYLLYAAGLFQDL